MKRKAAFSAITGILIAFCYAAGAPLDTYGSLDLMDIEFYVNWTALSIICSILIYCIWRCFGWITAKYKENDKAADQALKMAWWKKPAYALFLFLCWLPALLSLFPGAFAYDAYEEWQQVLLGNITSHHPVVHVLLLGGLVELGHSLTGNYNTGIAVYTILQMILMAWILSLTVSFLEEHQVPKVFRILSLIFYGLSPVMQLFSICATKDVLFTGAELLFFLYTLRFCYDRELFFKNKGWMSGFCITAFLAMIFRNNGLYIVLVMLVILAFFCRKDWKAHGKKLAFMLLGIMLPYALYVGPLYSILGVTPGGVEEKLSVPLQQLARVHEYDYESLEQNDLELLYRFVPQEYLEGYRPTVADFVKSGFQRQYFEEHKMEFVKLWMKWGAEHPLSYVNSFLVGSVDSWYPKGTLDGYRHADGRSSYFDYQVDMPGEEKVFLAGFHHYYEAISHDIEAQWKPFAFLVLNPGCYFVIFAVLFFYAWYAKRYWLLVVFFIPVLHFGTVLLGPIALVRYMLIFFYGMPVFLACVLWGDVWHRG